RRGGRRRGAAPVAGRAGRARGGSAAGRDGDLCFHRHRGFHAAVGDRAGCHGPVPGPDQRDAPRRVRAQRRGGVLGGGRRDGGRVLLGGRGGEGGAGGAAGPDGGAVAGRDRGVEGPDRPAHR